MCVKTDENQRFSYSAGFAARERMREAKPEKTRRNGETKGKIYQVYQKKEPNAKINKKTFGNLTNQVTITFQI